MLRIHFTDRDLAQLKVSADPLWETVLGVHQLSRRGASAFAPWRKNALGALRERELDDAVRIVRTLAPEHASYFPDFLTPADASSGLRAGLDALRATPRGQLAAELALAFRGRPAPGWVRRLAEGSADALELVARALHRIHATIIAPSWARTAALVEADKAVRTRALRDGGVHGLLSSLTPPIRWESPILHVPYPEDRDLHLEGRGLRLVPARFCWRTPVALGDPTLPQVLVYPIDPTSVVPSHGTASALAHLMGRTRFRVLAALDNSITTGELAEGLCIAASSASEHVSSLRDAGFAQSVRVGNHVLHTLSPLGREVLCSSRPQQVSA